MNFDDSVYLEGEEFSEDEQVPELEDNEEEFELEDDEEDEEIPIEDEGYSDSEVENDVDVKVTLRRSVEPERRASTRERRPPKIFEAALPKKKPGVRKPKKGKVIEVLDKKTDKGTVFYKVKREGPAVSENEMWEPLKFLVKYKDLLRAFEKKWKQENPCAIDQDLDAADTKNTALWQHNEKIVADSKVSNVKRLQFLKRHRETIRPFIDINSKNVKKLGLFADDVVEIEDVKDSLTEQPSYIEYGLLKEYQLQGINWLIRQHDEGMSCILADEMGLGKTVQTITLLSYLKFERGVTGPHLVLAPLSTLEVWLTEFARWSPKMKVALFHGNKLKRATLKNEVMVHGNFDVCVTNYESLLSEKHTFKKFVWRYIVTDEAHKIKSDVTNITAMVKSLRSQYKLLLTGTPLQNNLHELWNLLNYLIPDVFDSSKEFDECVDFKHNSVDPEKLLKISGLLEPFMLRRIKKDLDLPIPAKTETKIFLPLTQLQTDLYKSVLIQSATMLQQVSQKQTMILLNLILQLRKCCNHPYLLMDYPAVPDADQFIRCSAKLNFMDKLLPRLIKGDSRVLIYSQWTKTLDLIEEYMHFRGYSYLRLDGSTHQVERQFSIQRFNEDTSIFAFLISTNAGGLGINLATADTVILYDSVWNPAADLQAQARAHRLGQKKLVKVYRLVCEDTAEERVLDVAQRKSLLTSVVMNENEEQSEDLKGLSANELLSMIKVGTGAIFKKGGTDLTEADIDRLLIKAEDPEAHKKVDQSEYDFSKLLTEPAPIRQFQGKKYVPETNKQDPISKENILNGKRSRKPPADMEIKTFTEGQKVIKNKRPWTHEPFCYYCLKGDVDRKCQWCPRSYHLGCVEASGLVGISYQSRAIAWGCPWHVCRGCGKSSEAGYFFRCDCCPTALCFDCLPKKPFVVGKFIKTLVPAAFVPHNVMYIRCEDCVNTNKKSKLEAVVQREQGKLELQAQSPSHNHTPKKGMKRESPSMSRQERTKQRELMKSNVTQKKTKKTKIVKQESDIVMPDAPDASICTSKLES